MKRETFIKNAEIQRRQEIFSVAVLLACVFIAFLPAAILAERFDAIGFDLPSTLIALASFSIIGIAMYYFIYSLPRKRATQRGLVCPNCKRCFNPFTQQIVIASGRCGRCGYKILDDDSVKNH
jgi:hypothetical protein